MAQVTGIVLHVFFSEKKGIPSEQDKWMIYLGIHLQAVAIANTLDEKILPS